MKKAKRPAELYFDIDARAKAIFDEHRQSVYIKTDHLFSWFLLLQWLAVIACAFWISPKTWTGTTSQTHFHVWAAIILGGIIIVFPAFLAYKKAGQTPTRHLVGVAQMLIGAMLIHMTGGRIETHFHVFGSLAFLAFYRDWKVLVPATLVVAFDHYIRGVYWPQSVFGIMTPEPWRWLEHAGWVVFEDIFLIVSCLRSKQEIWEIAGHTARDEYNQQLTEAKVIERTEELQKSQGQLLQAQKMETVGNLAGGIAHDLNNQLTPVQGYLDMLLGDTKESDPRHAILLEASQAAQRCAGVVQRLVNFSKKSISKKSYLKPQVILDELKKIIDNSLPSTIKTQVHCEKDIWNIYGNQTELHTAFMNLAVNARDAMPNGGSLYIEVKNIAVEEKGIKRGIPEGSYVVFSVRDTGAGIPPAAIKRIFEPFFTTKEKNKGTGLGLAMVFGIIQDHGGWIDVSSEVGVGSIFQVYLPARFDQPAEDASDTTKMALSPGTETILMADDDEHVGNMGKVFLSRLGYKVIFAHDGQEAVEIYRQRRDEIAVILLDMTMPKLTGRQTIQKILEINPKAKIILASGYTSEGTSEELMRVGASGFLEKPYTIFILSQMLRKILDAP